MRWYRTGQQFYENGPYNYTTVLQFRERPEDEWEDVETVEGSEIRYDGHKRNDPWPQEDS